MGGGLLETNNQLERFTKNKKSKKLTYSMIGILLIIGSITLFKTYAFFEEKREFNVLKGKIPAFIENDVSLAISLNGKSINEYPKGTAYEVEVSCDHAKGNWNYETWGLDIGEIKGKTKCQINFNTNTSNLYYQSEIGDYVSYTSEKTSYEIASNLTGYNTVQTINPSELNLWRVIRKNNDGTLDLISEYTSTTYTFIWGKTGYKNYIGTLNLLARSYETEGITSRSRNMGFNGQTEFINDETFLDSENAPWGENTTAENSPKGSKRESLGGGDMLYLKDMELVQKAIGTLKANRADTKESAFAYWIAARKYSNSEEGQSFTNLLIHGDSGGLNGHGVYQKRNGVFSNRGVGCYLRPIITLNSTIQSISGDGTKGSPWKVN